MTVGSYAIAIAKPNQSHLVRAIVVCSLNKLEVIQCYEF